MGKTIRINFEDKTYTLEYNRRVVAALEDKGITVAGVIERPVRVLPGLFAGAFLMHHKEVRPEKIEKMFARTPNKDELMSKLCQMYNETLESLFEEPEGDEGNATWETDF